MDDERTTLTDDDIVTVTGEERATGWAVSDADQDDMDDSDTTDSDADDEDV